MTTTPDPVAEVMALADKLSTASKDYGVALARVPGFCDGARSDFIAARAALEAKVRELEKDAARWRRASTSRNFGITLWNEFGQATVYEQLAELAVDAAIDSARGTEGGKTP